MSELPGLGQSDASLIDDLSLRNRAYNLLYALGATPETVRTLLPGEASTIILGASEARDGCRATDLHCRIAALSPHLLRYVIDGRI